MLRSLYFASTCCCGMVRSQYSSNHVFSHRPRPHSTYTLPQHLPRVRQPLELVHLWRRAPPCWEPLHPCHPHSTTMLQHIWTRLTCTTVFHRLTLPWTAMRGLCMRHPHRPRRPATSLPKWVQFVRHSGWAQLLDQVCLDNRVLLECLL